MPIYEYDCPTCGTFEEMQKFSDPVLTVCPKGHTGVERRISASGFILKGSGWYATDYARKGGGGDGAKPNGASTGKSEAAPSGDARSSAESKPSTETKASPETRPAKTGSGG
jgi:putative FmdB family regulatory protein